MTNREKFKSVFGVDYTEVDFAKLADRPYGKCKRFRVQMCNIYPLTSHEQEVVSEIYVYAKSKQDAREIAIEELGDAYRRYVGSNRPMYALKIQECKEEQNEQTRSD